MTVTLKEIALAIERGEMALVGESAGYLILGAADAALKQLCLTELNTITLNSDGLVALCGPEADIHRVELSLRASLARLLSLCRREYPNLNRVAHRQEVRGLDLLVGELEASLVPVNRKAARRSLGRLFREAQRFQTTESKQLKQKLVAEKVATRSGFTQQGETPAKPIFAQQGETPVEPIFMRTVATESVDRLAQPEHESPAATDPLAGTSSTNEFEGSSLIRTTSIKKETEEESRFEEVDTTLFSPAIIEIPENTGDETETRAAAKPSEYDEQPLVTTDSAAGEPSEYDEQLSASTNFAADEPNAAPRVQPLERMSIGAFGWASNDKEEFQEPLIAVPEEQTGKGYSLNELLDAAQPARPSSRLMRELRQLSEVDHSPAPPEVK